MCKNFKKLADNMIDLLNEINQVITFNFNNSDITLNDVAIKTDNISFNSENKEFLFQSKQIEILNKINDYVDVKINNEYFLKNCLYLNDKFGNVKIKYANIEYKKITNQKQLNVAIFKKPKQFRKVNDYIIDRSNIPFAEFNLYEEHFILIMKNENLFLISDNFLQEDIFIKYATSIKLAIGLLACDFIGGDEIFACTDTSYKLINLKSFSMTSEQNLNFDIFTTCLPILFQRINQNNVALTSEQFTNLCRLISENEQLQVAVYYIAQSANLWVEHKLTFLAVALEALTGYIAESKNEKLLPDDIFTDIEGRYKDFLKTLNLENDIIEVLEGKFRNCKSNNTKLREPFEYYGITINKEDNEMIQKRNPLLHGKGFKYSKDIFSYSIKLEKQTKIYYHLLYSLLLKICGYSGIIINLKLWDEIVKNNNNLIGSNKFLSNFENYTLEI